MKCCSFDFPFNPSKNVKTGQAKWVKVFKRYRLLVIKQVLGMDSMVIVVNNTVLHI